MKFTRIKSSFSQNRRIPRLGRIRLGLKVKKVRQDGSSVEFPKETSWFVVPPEVEAVYGPNPTSLDIMLPSDNEEVIFPQSLAWFGRSKGLRCKGDGETAERLNEQTGQWEPRSCPCEHYRTKENPKGECTEQGILMFILPKVSVGGVYQLRTGSYNSVVDVNSGLDYIRSLIGRISMIPLKLRRVARETHADGKKQTHYTLSLTLDATVEGVNQLRSDTSRILSHAQLQIEGPVEENPASDPADITEADDSDDREPETVDAAALANMSDAEMARIQEEMAKKAKPVETPKPATVNGTVDISEEDWNAAISAIDDHPFLRDLKETVKAGMKVKTLKLTAPGKQEFIKRFKALCDQEGFATACNQIFSAGK